MGASDDAQRGLSARSNGSALSNGHAAPPASVHRPLLALVVVRATAQTVLIFAWGILAVAGLLLSAIVRLVSRRAAYDMNSAIAGSLWTYMQRAFEHTNGADITFSGHAIPEGESAIVIGAWLGWAERITVLQQIFTAGC